MESKYLHISQFLTLKFETLIDGCPNEVKWELEKFQKKLGEDVY